MTFKHAQSATLAVWLSSHDTGMATYTVQMVLTGSQNELHFSELPSSHSCLSRGVTCCSSNQNRFAWTTLSKKRQWNAGNSLAAAKKLLGTSFIFTGHSAIPPQYRVLFLNGSRLPLLCWFVVRVGKGKVEDTYRKSQCTTYCSFFRNICTVMLFFQQLDKDSTVYVMSTVLGFVSLVYNTPRPTGQADCIHSGRQSTRYNRANEVPPAPC